MAMSFRESFARVNSKDPTVTALTSLTVTATEGYTTMRDLTSCFHDGGWTVVAWDGESAPDLG